MLPFGQTNSINKNQRLDLVVMGECITPGNTATHRIASQNEIRQGEVFDYGAQDLELSTRRIVFVWHCASQSMAGQVQGDDSVFVAKNLDPGLPRVQ
tara:strand:- start:68 stop:358 length:291 start_codon:yes stop_codon:yes gene_type:complete